MSAMFSSTCVKRPAEPEFVVEFGQAAVVVEIFEAKNTKGSAKLARTSGRGGASPPTIFNLPWNGLIGDMMR